MKSSKKRLLNILVFILLFFSFSYLIFEVIDFKSVLDKISIFKYILIPLLSIFGSNTLTSSVLYPILFFLKATGMNIFVLVFLAALGGVIGDLIFLIFGKRVNEGLDEKFNGKIFNFFQKHKNSYYFPVFIFLYASFFPLPNELMTFFLGYVKYPLKKTLLPLALGNLLFYFLLITIGSSVFEIIF